MIKDKLKTKTQTKAKTKPKEKTKNNLASLGLLAGLGSMLFVACTAGALIEEAPELFTNQRTFSQDDINWLSTQYKGKLYCIRRNTVLFYTVVVAVEHHIYYAHDNSIKDPDLIEVFNYFTKNIHLIPKVNSLENTTFH